ncbi:MAG: hypothetical protein KAI67_01215 [Candidatus Pacebacteria bacterium]|nr:hypothetical protein [Candidatus Paceibacterota bacterium]
MAKSNETIEECLKSIDRRLIENKDEHKEILKTLKETAAKKVDKHAFDNSLRSSTKDKELIERRVDRAWNELVEMKKKTKYSKKNYLQNWQRLKNFRQ